MFVFRKSWRAIFFETPVLRFDLLPYYRRDGFKIFPNVLPEISPGIIFIYDLTHFKHTRNNLDRQIKQKKTHWSILQLEFHIISDHQIIYFSIKFAIVKEDLCHYICSLDKPKRFFQRTNNTLNCLRMNTMRLFEFSSF